MSFPPPQPLPVRCYEDGSCDPPGTTYGTEITPANATPPGPEYELPAQDRATILAAMQYGLEQRQPQLRGLFGSG